MVEVPQKTGEPRSNSAKINPQAQTSTGEE
jgi:hypothetical protein